MRGHNKPMAIMRGGRTIIAITAAVLVMGVARCGSDPNFEGAKLDLRNKDYDRALENISKAIENDPFNVEAQALKGEILQEVVRTTQNVDERAAMVAEMADAYERTVELEPERSTEVTRRMQVAYLVEFNAGIEAYIDAQTVPAPQVPAAFSQAAKLFRNASVLFPDSANAYVNEASAYYSGGLFGEAVETYEAALGMGHSSRQIFIYLTTVLDLLAERSSDRAAKVQLYRRATRVLQTGLENHPGDAELRDLLLNYYALAEESEDALAYYEEQYEAKRNDRVFLYNYGTLLLRVEDYMGAIEKLEEAVASDPGYTKARYNLGAALVNEGIRVAERYNHAMDSLDTHRSSLSRTAIARLETAIQEDDEQRNALFGAAIEQLERARSLAQNAQEDEQDICRALYRAYGHTNQRSKVDAVASCAGY